MNASLRVRCLCIEFPAHQEYSNYYRELDIGNAVATTRYQVGEVIYTRKVFSSFADQVVVVKLSANKAGQLNFTAHLSHPAKMVFTFYPNDKRSGKHRAAECKRNVRRTGLDGTP